MKNKVLGGGGIEPLLLRLFSKKIRLRNKVLILSDDKTCSKT
jgi:hypothetical protein